MDKLGLDKKNITQQIICFGESCCEVFSILFLLLHVSVSFIHLHLLRYQSHTAVNTKNNMICVKSAPSLYGSSDAVETQTGIRKGGL